VIPICAAEIHHAIRHEHARAADDVLSRRCRLGMVDEAEAMRLQPLVEQALDAAGINPGA
jgi:glycerol-3-phosphate dehydrogenase